MKRKNRSHFMVVVLVLLAVIIAGCSDKESKTEVKTDSPKPSESASAPTVKPVEPASFRILTENSPGWPVKKDWAVWKWVKEETNITILQETQTGPESIALSIASGDMPDLYSVYPEDAQKYGAEGAFLDLSKHMDKMPNVKAFLDARPDVAQRMTLPGGEMYHLLNDGAGAGSQRVWFYRDDIFQKHALEVPKTWEELYQTAKKLKELYPDSYPFVFRHGLGTLSAFGPSFGFYPSFFEDKDTGKIKYGVTDPAFKTMIEYLNKFYKEGLTPPDWLSMDYKAWTQFITTNKSFITVQYIPQIEIMNTQLQNGAHLKFMAPPLGAGSKAYIPKGDFEVMGFSVSSKTKNLDAVLRYLDFAYSDKGKDILSWGKEGETYTIENGKRKFMPQFKAVVDLPKEVGISSQGTYGLYDIAASISLSNENEQYSYHEAEKYQFSVIEALPILKAEEKAAIAVNEEQVTKYYSTSIAKFILGETPFTQWDAFINELNKLGVQKIQDAYQLGLDRIKVK